MRESPHDRSVENEPLDLFVTMQRILRNAQDILKRIMCCTFDSFWLSQEKNYGNGSGIHCSFRNEGGAQTNQSQKTSDEACDSLTHAAITVAPRCETQIFSFFPLRSKAVVCQSRIRSGDKAVTHSKHDLSQKNGQKTVCQTVRNKSQSREKRTDKQTLFSSDIISKIACRDFQKHDGKCEERLKYINVCLA